MKFMGQMLLSSLSIFLLVAYCTHQLWTRRDRNSMVLVGVFLVCASVETFDLLAILFPSALPVWKRGALISESLLPFAFYLFSLIFYRREALKTLSKFQVVILVVALVFVPVAVFLPFESFFYSPDFVTEKMLFLGQPGYLYFIGIVSYLVFSLVQLERTYRALSKLDRWRVKFELIGIGALLAMLVVYYSQGLLYRSINMNLLPVRSVAILVGVGMMIFSRLRRGDARSVSISREMAFRSVVVLMVGVYFLGLGLIGEGMRYWGDSSQRSFLIVLGFVSGIALVVILLSETLRRKIKVFIHKNFYTQKYDYRSQWLAFTNKLSAARNEENLQEGILSFFMEAFAVQGATLFLFDTEGGIYRNFAGAGNSVADRVFEKENALIHYLVEEKKVFYPGEKNPPGEVITENGAFLERNGISFIVPMQLEEPLEGFVVLGRQINGRERPTYEDFDLMKMLARQAISTLLSFKLSAQLSTARELAAIGKVSAFMLHDLKNLVSGLALVSENARSYLDEPEFQKDMLETLESTVVKMNGMIVRLKNLEEKAALSLEVCDLREIVSDGVRAARSGSFAFKGEPVFARVDPVEIHKVVLNLTLNALEAVTDPAAVSVEVGSGALAYFRITDKGCGMSDDFVRERLFKPFETTKNNGFGIGLYQCKNIVEAHGGRIEVESGLGRGTAFTVLLPLADKGG